MKGIARVGIVIGLIDHLYARRFEVALITSAAPVVTGEVKAGAKQYGPQRKGRGGKVKKWRTAK